MLGWKPQKGWLNIQTVLIKRALMLLQIQKSIRHALLNSEQLVSGERWEESENFAGRRPKNRDKSLASSNQPTWQMRNDEAKLKINSGATTFPWKQNAKGSPRNHGRAVSNAPFRRLRWRAHRWRTCWWPERLRWSPHRCCGWACTGGTWSCTRSACRFRRWSDDPAHPRQQHRGVRAQPG